MPDVLGISLIAATGVLINIAVVVLFITKEKLSTFSGKRA